MTATANVSWVRLPEEMRELDQWCVAGEDKAPQLFGIKGFYNASPVKGPWLTFEAACELAQSHSLNIGFVITESDPFTCVDLDVKDIDSVKPTGEKYKLEEITTKEALDFYCTTVERFESYTELSGGGKGIHVWVKGAIGAGIKAGNVEIYSQERFIVCTGNALSAVGYNTTAEGRITARVVNPYPNLLANRQALADQFAANLQSTKGNGKLIDLVELAEEHSDDVIWERARTAGNSEKFIDLCEGQWEKYTFPSQSEADTALLSMFTFYSRSNTQCRRMFRQTALGQRSKATKNDYYIDLTLKMIRSREAKDAQVKELLVQQSSGFKDAFKEQIEEAMLSKERENNAGHANNLRAVFAPLIAAVLPQPQQPTPAPPAAFPTHGTVPLRAPIPIAGNAPPFEPVVDSTGDIDWPPGITGDIAKYIFSISSRPVKLISIAAAIGLVAGIVGKSYNYSGTGLNIYMILVAKSGIGKDGLTNGINKIVSQVATTEPRVYEFIMAGKFASGPALTKLCKDRKSFVQLIGEFGKMIKRLGDDSGRDTAMETLRTTMTDLYQKSGEGDIAGGIHYSNQEQTVDSYGGVAYSLIGESTPGLFRDGLTESMMEDGFLSRFSIIEYKGDRVVDNEDAYHDMEHNLLERISYLVGYSLRLLDNNKVVKVQVDATAKAMLREFSLLCDNEINGTESEGWRQMWNRAHLKVLRLSAMLASTSNCETPIIEPPHVMWSMTMVRRDIDIMTHHLNSGDIGSDDLSRDKKVIGIIRKYLTVGPPPSYGIPLEMTDAFIIPRKHIQNATSRLNQFKNHKMGSTNALNSVIKSLTDLGMIIVCDKKKIIEDFPGMSHGTCYKVLHLPGEKELQ